MKYFKDDRSSVIKFIIFCVICSRVAMLLLYIAIFKNYSITDFINHVSQWDVKWYENIVNAIVHNDYMGYSHVDGDIYEHAVWAFFPLYSITIAPFYYFLSPFMSIYQVGMMLNVVYFSLAMYIGHKYIMLTRNDIKRSYLYIFLMSFGPWNMYFFVMYTESLFLLLLTLCFYYLKKKNYILMGVFGALLSATRNVGVLFVFVVLFDTIKNFIEKNQNKQDRSAFSLMGEYLKEVIDNYKLVLGTCMVPMGLFSYIAFLEHELGDGLAFVHVQTGWSRVSGIKSFIINIKEAAWNVFPPDILVTAFFVAIVFVIVLIKDKRYEEAIFPGIILIVAGMSSFMSIPRFMLGSFTVCLAFVDQLSKMSTLKKLVIGFFLIIFSITIYRAYLLGNTVLF